MAYLGSISSLLLSTVFVIFLIATIGYLVGGIKIKGISLGTAGVLLIALIFGVVASYVPFITIGGKNIILYLAAPETLDDGTTLNATTSLFSLVSSLGTSMFVTAVGLIAGPKFFRTFNRKSIGYILMGIIIIAIGTLVSAAVIQFSKDPNVDSSLVIGLMTGALTSTPGFSAAKEVAMDDAKVTAGYGIGYLFGVLGVVFFVQLVPRILRVDIDKERETFVAANSIEIKYTERKLTAIDPYGFFPFVLAIVFGNLIGCIKIPRINFSLGASGGYSDCRIDHRPFRSYRFHRLPDQEGDAQFLPRTGPLLLPDRSRRPGRRELHLQRPATLLYLWCPDHADPHDHRVRSR